MTMQIFHYDAADGLFLEADEARVAPGREDWPDTVESGKFLCPAHATFIEPLTTPPGMVTVFNETAQTWSLVEDHRGEQGWIDGVASTITGIGTYPPGWSTTPPVPPPAPIPEIVSDRQFYQQLAIEGQITQSEALAAVQSGTLPAKIATMVNGLTPSQQFAAKMLLSGETAFSKSHPLLIAFGKSLGWDKTKMIQVWVDASKL